MGKEYLRCFPVQADPHLLTHQLCSRVCEYPEKLLKENREDLRRLLQVRQREDFATDRIVIVQGWLLSETEAQLCALIALTVG